MARGLPAVWSTLFALPLVAAGGYLAVFRTRYPLVAAQPRTRPVVGALLVAFGLFVFGLGLYVHFVAAPEAPRMRGGETVVDQRDPAQRNALAEAVVSLPVLGVGGYLLYFTDSPLVYPTLASACGLYLFSSGLYRYWRNTLTTYFVTTRRVIEEYRFISLVRNEVPHGKVRGVEERRSAWDSLFGLGSIAVRSGASGELTVSVDGVYDPTEFADVVRDQLRADADTAAASPSAEERSPADVAGEGGTDAEADGADDGATNGVAADDATPSESDGTDAN